MDSRGKRLVICSSATYRAGQANAIAQKFEDRNLRERGHTGIFLGSIRDITPESGCIEDQTLALDFRPVVEVVFPPSRCEGW